MTCHCRGVINGKAGKAAALPKFSNALTLSQRGGTDYAHPLALPHLKISCGYAPTLRFHNKGLKIEFKMSRFQIFYDAK